MLRALKDPLVLKAFKVRWVLKAIREHKVIRVFKAIRVFKVM